MKNSYFLALLFCIFIGSGSIYGQTTYNINDPEQLEDNTYVAGDVIILANGVYNTDERIDFIGNGTSANPIIFRAESPGGVKFTGGLQMNIGGDYVVVDGFHWQGGFGASNFIQFRNGTDYANHSTIQNCVIDGLEIHPDDIADDIANSSITKHRWIVLYGTYNTVINCSFMNKVSAGALVLAEYQYNAEDDPCAIVGHTITNNYFYNYEKIDNTLSNSGDSETIRIGSSENQNVSSNVTVINNYFVEADGENEIITNKSKGNLFINNTFRRCRGSLVLRHGSEATVDGNYFLGEDVEGTGGIRISDSNHDITNNYIQDCITVNSQAKWNNGITFLGGGDANAVPCTASNTTNGYQQSENINLSNNTIINTNAPLFYNIDKGSTDPTGTVTDNLIYFAAADPNITNVFTGDTPTSYVNLGTALTYTRNVYTGTVLGETNTGFSEETGITATANGEIFTFSGAGSSGKGADLGTYEPTTDAMVGYGIGACFVDYLGGSIIDGDCNIEVVESLTVDSLPEFSSDAGSNDVAVFANVSWTAVSNVAWISINITSGTGDAMLSVAVTENVDTNPRAGTVTFTQVPGGDDIVRTLNVTQEGVDLTDLYDLINDVPGGGSVSVHSFSQQQVEPENNRFNYATNTLDKVIDSHWTAQDGAIVAGDYKGDGEYVIFDLGTEYNLDLIQIATDDKDDPYGLQIWLSTSGTDLSDFSIVLPASSDDLLITTTTGSDEGLDQYEITANARYVKLIGFGRFNTAGTARQSPWNNITEIEFFGSQVLSVSEVNLENSVSLYPIPAKDFLNIKSVNSQIELIQVYSLDGRKVIEKPVDSTIEELSIDTSALVNGAYIVNLSNKNQSISKMIVISK
ncbi:MAG: chondroitinase-B domain-containing protein [Winogradskyella sp.]|uniref:chondroitinase-B domain-containing protein n=1 Tax=Winogradskyella sp. TaxID=1883156 RepID=UPI00385BBD87